MKEKKTVRLLKAVNSYAVFFLMVAFAVTCCMMLFLRTLSTTMGLTFDAGNIAAAAKITFWNVMLITFLFTVFDFLRRKFTVERPVRRITEAAEKMAAGDFSVGIAPIHGLGAETFNPIIEAVNRMALELSGVETLRNDFIANVSHEMKTPLAVMRNYGAMLQSENLSEDKRMEYARAVTEGSRRLADMMTNILKLNRLENQQIYPKVEEYDLGEQLCQCLLGYENVWEEEGIDIETDIAGDIRITADAELLSLVWNNLLSNAFKFTPRGGSVCVRLTADERYATVQVKDTGCGMTAEVGAHIFEKFYQGDPSRATRGNGLGLALVKRVVDILQGEISVESAVGVGSAFTVKIPRS